MIACRISDLKEESVTFKAASEFKESSALLATMGMKAPNSAVN